MAFQTPITIEEAVLNVYSRAYLLPAIQREVVWHADQITRLFDSLMRDYPIGSFLFWRVDKQNVGKYQFYEFLRDYHERDNRHNQKASITGQEDVTGVLDGQQRLTSLYIGLMGTYSYKEPRKRRDNPLAYPVRKLYLNLLSKRVNSDETDMYYDFAFLTENEAKLNQAAFWYLVADIMKLKEIVEVNSFLIREGLMDKRREEKEFANSALFRLWKVVHDTGVINYYLEKSESLDKVLAYSGEKCHQIRK